MKRFSKIAVVLTVLALALAFVSCNGEANPLRGTTYVGTADGQTCTLEFRSDGTYVETIVVDGSTADVIFGVYVVSGTTATLTASYEGSPQTFQVTTADNWHTFVGGRYTFTRQ